MQPYRKAGGSTILSRAGLRSSAMARTWRSAKGSQGTWHTEVTWSDGATERLACVHQGKLAEALKAYREAQNRPDICGPCQPSNHDGSLWASVPKRGPQERQWIRLQM